ncbi:serine hydrolase domain-containing protein [Allorhizocola rhizosphaerae]|uniref:serine hydrolase domain-containing protein n=1 Tax=Allorhizocola rhizosphaerae TaxID=1872709 RepID=UPI000E3D2066|nr:serine hydrolase domain-containing protein [Allorhizocola rhizosphaerae]
MTTRTDELTAKIRAFRDRHGLPGIAAALVSVDGIRTSTAGVRVRSGEEPVGAADPWHIGSCGKSMTAVLYARLVQRGQAQWHGTVGDLLADVDPHPAWRGVTMTDLLTHCAGLPGNLTQHAMKAAYSDMQPEAAQRTQAAERALAEPPVKYGKFLYSNLGYIIAGAAIERITAVSYQEALRREVLQPLGMDSAGFGAPTGDVPWGHRPRWLVYGSGEAVDPHIMSLPHPADNPPVMTPAGRLHLSLDDWARFIRLFMRDGGGMLTDDSLQRITTPPTGRTSYQGMGWAVPTREASPVAHVQQGSNLRWIATALLDRERRKAVLVATNDGRPSLLKPCLRLGVELLEPLLWTHLSSR